MREKKCGECRNAPYFFVMQHTLAKLPDSRYNWNVSKNASYVE